MDQVKLNAEYQATLNKFFDGRISLRGKYLNPKAVVPHHCKHCMTNFWARPLWLISEKQPHECFAGSIKPGKEKKAAEMSIDKAKKVTEDMKLEMVRLYQEGVTVSDIRRKFGLAHKTVDYHLKKAGVK